MVRHTANLVARDLETRRRSVHARLGQRSSLTDEFNMIDSVLNAVGTSFWVERQDLFRTIIILRHGKRPLC